MTPHGQATNNRRGFRSIFAHIAAIALSFFLLSISAVGQSRDEGFVPSDLPAIPSSASAISVPSALPYSSLAVQPEYKSGRTLYRWSVAALLAGNVADIASSWHRPEANPLLATPGAKFDVGSVALKSGFIGASLVIEYWALRHNRHLYKGLAWMNYAVAGGLGVVVEHNVNVK